MLASLTRGTADLVSAFHSNLRLNQQKGARPTASARCVRQRALTKEMDMQIRLMVLVLASLAILASTAFAQGTEEFAPTGISQDDIVGPLPPQLGSIACFKLVDEPNFCVLPDRPHIINHTIPFNVIDLNGGWVDQNGVHPYIYVYNSPSSNGGYTISVDLSLVNRPDGFGYFLSGSAISIVFPDDRDYTGVLENNGRTIRWSNNTVWTKL